MSTTFGAAGHEASISLTDAQIKALHSTPILLVPSPGIGRMLVPVSAWFFVNTEAGVYACAGDVELHLITHVSQIAWFDLGSFDAALEQAAKISYILPLNQSVLDSFTQFYSDVAEQGLDVYLSGANPTLGNAANFLRITLAYLIVNTVTGQFE